MFQNRVSHRKTTGASLSDMMGNAKFLLELLQYIDTNAIPTDINGGCGKRKQ